MATVFSTLNAVQTRRPSMVQEHSGRAAGVAGAIVFHLLLLAALFTYAPARQTLSHVTPIVVSLIAETRPAPLPQPAPPPPKIRHQPLPAPVERVVEPPPILIEALTPSPIAVPPPAPTPPQPPVEAAYAPVPAPPAPAPITPPRFNADYLQNPAPPYPALARRMREQGKVLVRVLVSTDGVAEQIELKSSSGSTRLDQSALDTVKSWKFVPARQGDQKVSAWVVVPITFALEG